MYSLLNTHGGVEALVEVTATKSHKGTYLRCGGEVGPAVADRRAVGSTWWNVIVVVCCVQVMMTAYACLVFVVDQVVEVEDVTYGGAFGVWHAICGFVFFSSTNMMHQFCLSMFVLIDITADYFGKKMTSVRIQEGDRVRLCAVLLLMFADNVVVASVGGGVGVTCSLFLTRMVAIGVSEVIRSLRGSVVNRGRTVEFVCGFWLSCFLHLWLPCVFLLGFHLVLTGDIGWWKMKEKGESDVGDVARRGESHCYDDSVLVRALVQLGLNPDGGLGGRYPDGIILLEFGNQGEVMSQKARQYALFGDRYLEMVLVKWALSVDKSVGDINWCSQRYLSNSGLARVSDVYLSELVPGLKFRSEKTKGNVVELLVGVAVGAGLSDVKVERFIVDLLKVAVDGYGV